MCVVALTASIAACNIKLVDEIFQPLGMNVTLSRLGSSGPEHRVFWGCMYEVTLKNRVKGINWHTAVFIGLFHVGAVAALFVFNWKALLIAILLWWVAGSLGVGIGFHRLLTHR